MNCLNAFAVHLTFVIHACGADRTFDDYETSADHERYNVLHIIIDDLRPELGIYRFTGTSTNPGILTPHMDALAREGTMFTHAYTQFALCCPSRSSFLTSRRPDSTRVFTNTANWRTNGGNFTTLPQYFREFGYQTMSFGKIFHGQKQTGGDDTELSWSVPPWHSKEDLRWNTLNKSWYIVPEEEQTSEDQLAASVQHKLKQLSRERRHRKTLEKTKPFYMAVGFYKPHLPFFAKKNFFDLYPIKEVKLASNRYVPTDMPLMAWSNYNELRNYKDIAAIKPSPRGPTGFFNVTLPNKAAKSLRRAYYAAVSNTDNLIGQILFTLVQTGLNRNTIVALHGDHGWQLGEHAEWSKMTNFDVTTRVPLMIKVPGLDQQRMVQRIVELVDIFPTLVDLAELPLLPPCPKDKFHTEACTEGLSLVPLIRNRRFIHRKKRVHWTKPAFSQSFRPEGPYMGYSIRTEHYRYTKWVNYDTIQFKPLWASTVGEELYEYNEDPNENRNIATDDQFQNIKNDLETILMKGWSAFIPPTDKKG